MRQAARVALRTVRWKNGQIMRRRHGRVVLDIFMAHHATRALSREVAVNTVRIAGLRETRVVGCWLTLLMAFDAEVFFMACSAAVAIP